MGWSLLDHLDSTCAQMEELPGSLRRVHWNPALGSAEKRSPEVMQGDQQQGVCDFEPVLSVPGSGEESGT